MNIFDLVDIIKNMGDGEKENHPFSVFLRLYSENPNNKVYKNCLENEIDNVVQTLNDKIDNSILFFLKEMIDSCFVSDEELDLVVTEKKLKDEIKIQQYAITEIIRRVYELRFSKD